MGSKQTHFLRNTRIPFKGRGRVGNRATEKCSRGLGSVTNTYSSIARFNAPSLDTTKHKQNHQLLKLVWGVGAGGGGERAFGWKSTEESWLQFLRVRTASPRETVCAKNPCPETEG